jgi:alpha-beta hydrolase superfamily lysophospholipase
MIQSVYARLNWRRQGGLVLVCCVALALPVLAQPGSNKGAAAPVKSGLPANVRSEEVRFPGVELTLAGTLLIPKLDADKRAPALLLVAGTGPATRDGAKLGGVSHSLYRELAEHFAGQGWVVLRYDKRCAGSGACKPKTTFDLLVDDARDALAYLRKRPEVEPSKVFLLGHGEGGFVSSVVASNDETLAGLIMAAAPGRTLNKLLREQLQVRMKEAGRPEAEIAAQIAKFDWLVRNSAAGVTTDLSAGLDPRNPFDAVLLNVFEQPELFIPLFINDPLQVVGALKTPVLIIQGEKDVETSTKDAEYLNEALSRAQHADHTLRLLPGLDHLLKPNKGAPGTAVYAETRPVDASVLALLTEWMQKRMK